MTNCLAECKFENLLFVNVRIQDEKTIALFDTGAGMTVIARSVLARLGGEIENSALHAGNNSGTFKSCSKIV